MKQKSGPGKAPAEQVLKDIRRQTRRQYSGKEKIRIVLEGLRGEENISELCRREGIAASSAAGGWAAISVCAMACRTRARRRPKLQVGDCNPGDESHSLMWEA